MTTGSDPAAALPRRDRLAVHRAWFEERAYDLSSSADLYPVKDGGTLALRLPAARIITNRHLGLELKTPPEFRVQDAATEKWLNRILKLNGFRGSMRAAAAMKSWAGDVGVLFSWRPTERAVLGTPWQVAFISPQTYTVTERHPSGVFKAVDVFTFEDVQREPRIPGQWVRVWTRTQYRVDVIRTWPTIDTPVNQAVHPPASEFDAMAGPTKPIAEVGNLMGVIPFALVQNLTSGTQEWAGDSDYTHLTHLFHRLNIKLDSLDQGDQIRNRLLMALIDAEDVFTEVSDGITALRIQSDQSGASDRGAQLIPTPLLQAGDPMQFMQTLLDLVMEAAGVAQTGNTRELFGNEAASSSALQTFYSLQTAVAEAKRANWLGERADYGLSALGRKLISAAARLDRQSPVFGVEDTSEEKYDLTLTWPPMFAPSAPERQTLASVAQQANDDGLPPEHIAPMWATALGTSGLKAINDIKEALTRTQDRINQGLALRPTGDNAQRGILGSGQGDGLLGNGGSATETENPE